VKVAAFFEPKPFNLPPLESREVIGGNNPPDLISHAQTVIDDINSWLSDHPVIETEEQSREAKPFLDRAKAALDEIEAERDGKVRPLNDTVDAINAKYKALHNVDKKKPGLFDRIVNELKSRVSAFMVAEEARRAKEAEAARLAQEEAERIAREAEEREREALANAAAGEVVNVAEVTQAADEAFNEFERTSRFAARAEKDTRVKIGGGFQKAVALRTVETLHLDSYALALKAIGPQDKIRDAILSAARDYRNQHGKLPEGVRATTERKL
jgi:dTMP kinase